MQAIHRKVTLRKGSDTRPVCEYVGTLMTKQVAFQIVIELIQRPFRKGDSWTVKEYDASQKDPHRVIDWINDICLKIQPFPTRLIITFIPQKTKAQRAAFNAAGGRIGDDEVNTEATRGIVRSELYRRDAAGNLISSVVKAEQDAAREKIIKEYLEQQARLQAAANAGHHGHPINPGLPSDDDRTFDFSKSKYIDDMK